VEIRCVAVVLLVLMFAACGTGNRPARAGEWRAGALLVIDQLRGDVDGVAGADRLPAARGALADESKLYGLLISFSDVAGCRHMVSTLGVRPPRFVVAEQLLGRACAPLQRAAALFTRATSRDDPRALVAAVRQATSALALLDRARLALARTG
jgi:hypothetical protein